jgi:ferredoxin
VRPITVKTSSLSISLDLPKIFINPDLCINCGVCGEICPFGLPQPNNNEKFEIFEPERCTECSACKRKLLWMRLL